MKALVLSMLVFLPAFAARAARARSSSRPGHDTLLALKGGYFLPGSKLGGAAFGALELGYITPLLGHHLAFTLEGDFYRPALSGSVSSPQLTVNGTTASGAYRLTDREIAVLLFVEYRFAPFGRFSPYVGVGPGLYLHQAKTTAFDSTNTEQEGNVGAQAMLGVDYRVGPGALLLEAQYHFSRVDFRTTGKANVGGFLIGLGYRFMF